MNLQTIAAVLLLIGKPPASPPTAPDDPVGEWVCISYANGPRIQVTRKPDGTLHARYLKPPGSDAPLKGIGPHRFQWTEIDEGGQSSKVSTFRIANNTLHLRRAMNTAAGSRGDFEDYRRTTDIRLTRRRKLGGYPGSAEQAHQ